MVDFMENFEITLSIANVSTFWLICGAACIAIEAFITGVGFLFVGLASISTGGLIASGLIDPANLVAQISIFLGLTFLWAVILWTPLQKFLKRSGFQNIIGGTAIVESNTLASNTTGNVKWSGTTMLARLDKNSQPVSKGDEVVITAMEGNVLTVILKQ
ncbi:MAG: hypothetical protein K0R98_1261 [Rickettsiaceae bacterium]|jgi:membrane protein implicated in regulation of membrane protease activity|nr:hypothetical protein [Rickettsiaceae bacterium]